MSSYNGVVKARIVDVRFATSGKVVSVRKFVGDTVKKGELIASLDRKVAQTTLDRELADFEKVRADFEIFNQKNPDPTEEIDKYLKTEKQASLDASVKNVELAKVTLDQCDLFSPVDGIVMDDNSVVAGINITPASSSFKIIDSSSYFAEVEIEEKDIKNFMEPKDVKVNIPSLEKELNGKTSVVYGDGKKFYVRIPIFGERLMVAVSIELEI